LRLTSPLVSCHPPQADLGIWRLSCEQAGEGIMGGSLGIFRLTASGFGTGEDLLSRYHKVYVVQFITLGWVHSYSPPLFFHLLGVYPVW
jgi:hypothetical protein